MKCLSAYAALHAAFLVILGTSTTHAGDRSSLSNPRDLMLGQLLPNYASMRTTTAPLRVLQVGLGWLSQPTAGAQVQHTSLPLLGARTLLRTQTSMLGLTPRL